MRIITVVPYNAAWSDEFRKIKDELVPALSETALAIEHVGSTSVPGLFAKPIIDIDIVIDMRDFGVVQKRLAGLGYTHVGDLGIPGREAFKYEDKPHLMEHHLCVCDKNADELKRHIALRNFLRGNNEYRDKYSQIKQAMAIKYPHDIDNYILGKQPVILEIYEKCGLDTSYKNSQP
ncbi:MAG: GrpB family protein [Defluviitaleaceae bacterium]|nr:GrpB family protein [Defluviitaleaceae bacterium]